MGDTLQETFIQKGKSKSWKAGDMYKFFVASLKGISQIMLIENSTTGVLILVAITIASPYLGMITLLSVMIGTFVAKVSGANHQTIQAGLFGYNSALTGLALAFFLVGPYAWIIALFGAAIVALLTAAFMHSMKETEIPVLTFPFVIITWFLLLTSYKLNVFQLSPSLTSVELANMTLDFSGTINWFDGFVLSIAQIFFLDHLVSGILLFIALFLAGWRYGVYAVIATITSLLTAYVLGGEHSLISLGLYGYNAILTIIAVSIVFKDKENVFALYSGIFGASLTIVITASITIWLFPLGLPALTMAFILSTWLFLAARKVMPNL